MYRALHPSPSETQTRSRFRITTLHVLRCCYENTVHFQKNRVPLHALNRAATITSSGPLSVAAVDIANYYQVLYFCRLPNGNSQQLCYTIVHIGIYPGDGVLRVQRAVVVTHDDRGCYGTSLHQALQIIELSVLYSPFAAHSELQCPLPA